MGILEDIHGSLGLLHDKIAHLESKINKLIEQKAPKDRSDKADKIDKALSEKVNKK